MLSGEINPLLTDVQVNQKLANLKIAIERTEIFLKAIIEQFFSQKSDIFSNAELKNKLASFFGDILQNVTKGELSKYAKVSHLAMRIDEKIEEQMEAFVAISEDIKGTSSCLAADKALADELLVALARLLEKWKSENTEKIVDKDTIWKALRPYAEQQIRAFNSEVKAEVDALLGKLRVITEKNYRAKNFTVLSADKKHPECFISYAWPLLPTQEFDESWTQPFIYQLVNDLRLAGINAKMDLTHSRLGHDSVAFMEKGINEGDMVILVGTKSLHQKYSNEKKFGASVRKEINLIIERQRINRERGRGDRIFPLILSGSLLESLPADFKSYTVTESFLDQGYLSLLKKLLQRMYKNKDIDDAENVFIKSWELLESNEKCKPLFKGLPNAAVQQYYLQKVQADKENEKKAEQHGLELVKGLSVLSIPQSHVPPSLSQVSSGANETTPSIVTAGSSSVIITGGIALAGTGHVININVPKSTTASNRRISTWQLPPPNNYYVPRTKIEEKIQKKLAELHNKEGIVAVAAYHGIGGIGKSALATRIIYQASDYTFRGWFKADNARQLTNQFRALGEKLELFDGNISTEDAIASVIDYFEQQQKCLIVFDNAQDIDTLQPFLPNFKVDVIVTSRSNHWQNAIEISVMEPDEAIALVKKIIGRDDQNIEKLVVKLGCLPLALIHAAAFIKDNISVAKYLEMYQEESQRLLADTTLPPGMSGDPVAITWNITFNVIKNHSLNASKLLQCCAYLDNNKIPCGLLINLLLGENNSEAAINFTQIKRLPLLYSMLHADVEQDSLSIHCVVQEVLRFQQPPSVQKEILNSLVRALNHYQPDTDDVAQREKNKQALLPHIENVAQHYERLIPQNEWTLEYADLLGALGFRYSEIGDNELQEKSFSQQVDILLRYYAEDSTKLSTPLTNLANGQLMLGKNKEARDNYQWALKIVEEKKVIGHPDVAIILSTFCQISLRFGDTRHCKRQMDRAYEILMNLTKSYGSYHLICANLSRSYLHFGKTYHDSGALERAIILSTIKKDLIFSIYGDKHPRFAEALQHLAMAIAATELESDIEQAEVLLKQALEVLINFYGNSWEEIANYYVDMVLVNADRKKDENLSYLQKADELLHKSSKITKYKSNNLTNLAIAYYRIGAADCAIELLESLISMNEEKLGKSNLELVFLLTHLAQAYSDKENHTKREELLNRALAINERFNGSDHISSSYQLNFLAETYAILKRHLEEIDVLQRLLLISRKFYEDTHIDILRILQRLVTAFRKISRNNNAITIQQELIALLKKSQGSDSTVVADECRVLASIYIDDDNSDNALAMLSCAMSTYKKQSTVEPDALAEIFFEMGKCQKKLNKSSDDVSKNLELALALFPDSESSKIECLSMLSEICLERNNYDQAFKYLNEACRLAQLCWVQTNTRFSHFMLAHINIKIANLHNAQKEYAQAIQRCEQAGAIINNYDNKPKSVMAKFYSVMAFAHKELQQLDKAKEYYDRAINMLAALGVGHTLQLLPDLSQLASICLQLKQFEQAKELLERILHIFEEMYPITRENFSHVQLFKYLFLNVTSEDLNDEAAISALHNRLLLPLKDYSVAAHAMQLIILTLICDAYLDIDKNHLGKNVLEEIIGIKDSVYGVYHESTTGNLVKLASICGQLQNFKEAISYLERAYTITTTLYGVNDSRCEHFLSLMGITYKFSDDIANAFAAYEKCLIVQTKNYPPNHPAILKTLESIIHISESKGDSPIAKSFLEKMLPFYERAYGTFHPVLAKVFKRIAGLSRSLEEYKQAIAYYSNALEIHRKTMGEDNEEYGMLLGDIALTYGDIEDATKQLKLSKAAVRVFQSIGADRSMYYINILNTLAGAYFKLKKFEKARQQFANLLLQCDEIFDQSSLKAIYLQNLGFTLAELKDYKQAVTYLLQARTIFMRSQNLTDDIVEALSRIYKRVPKLLVKLSHNECILFEKEILRGNEDDSNTLILIANINFSRNQLNEAINYLEIALAIDPQADCWTSLACCYDAMGDSKKAEEIFQRHLGNNENLDGYEAYALCLYRQKKYHEAIQVLQKIYSKWTIISNNLEMGIEQDIYILSFNLGEKIRLDSKLQNELELAEELVVVPTIFIYYLLIHCYAAIGDDIELAKYLDEFEQIVTHEANDVSLHYRMLGFCYELMGDHVNAVECFSKADDLLEDDEKILRAENAFKLSTKDGRPANAESIKMQAMYSEKEKIKQKKKDTAAHNKQLFHRLMVEGSLVPTFFLPTVVEHLRMLTLDDGNCAYNGLAYGLCDLVKLDLLPFNQQFYEILQKTCGLESASVSAFKSWVMKVDDEYLWQKHISVACRLFAVQEIKKKYDILQESFEELIWSAYLLQQADPLNKLDDTFIVHKHIADFFTEPNLNREQVIEWWGNAGKDQYLSNIEQSALTCLDKSRWGSEVEINILACALNINVTWQKELGSQQLGIGGGLIELHKLTDADIKQLVEHGIGQKYLNHFRIYSFDSRQKLHECLSGLDQILSSKIIQVIVNSNNNTRFPETITGIADMSELTKKLEARNILTRKKDKKYYFITTPEGNIDKEEIISRMQGLSKELSQLILSHFVENPVIIKLLFEENHWTYLRDANIAVQLVHQDRLSRWNQSTPDKNKSTKMESIEDNSDHPFTTKKSGILNKSDAYMPQFRR